MALSRNKKILIGAGAIVVIGVVIGVSVSRRSDLPEVQTATIERRATLEAKVTANGEVRPPRLDSIQSEVTGRVTDVFVKEGDLVKKGTPLLRVDPTQIASATSIQEAALRAVQADVQNQISAMTTAENAINSARAALSTSQADLDRANIERRNAEIELKRATDLLESNIGTRRDYDSAKMRFDSSTASVNAAKARVEQSNVQIKDAEIRVVQAKTAIDASKARAEQQQASLAQQTDLLRKTTQYATIDGVVGGPIVQVGTFALANFSSTQLMFIVNMSTINVDVNVDETDIANVKVGQNAKVKVDALGDTEIEGQVIEIAQTAKTRSGQTIAQTATTGSQEAKDFKVIIRLVNVKDEVRDRLRPGMSATATISTDRRESVITVPLQALVERDQDQIKTGSSPTPTPTPAAGQNQNPKDKKPVKGVFVIQNNKTVFTPVETGITGDNDIEIKSGLNQGQEIVTGPYRQLRTLKHDQAIKREDKNKKPAGSASNENK
ncbi:MAG TPA: efflux RND transporter periplasmic adaptor subunit [Blastocatellia bacterium]|nr:efflux RND transporter periplasmic adaptor subunit [Blastocatellia bacterium]